MTNPSTNPKQRQYDNTTSKENPTSVRNGKGLLQAALDAVQYDRCRTAIIQPQHQFFYLDCQPRVSNDVSRYDILWDQQGHKPDRWLAKNTHGLLCFAGPPSSVSTGRFTFSPALLRIWAEIHKLEQSEHIEHPKLVHYLVVQGDSANRVQKFSTHWTVIGALNSAFYALANGFEVTFAASFLADQIDSIETAALEICMTVDDLKAIQARTVMEAVDDDLRYIKTIGVIC